MKDPKLEELLDKCIAYHGHRNTPGTAEFQTQGLWQNGRDFHERDHESFLASECRNGQNDKR